ncbi:PEPxxWA-CTERM sorting domain-containing protein [Croceibacterium salegens]|uniref:PEPxxWA-CTERM sorting domain-containing protein n=1 Tax=Croceibacterium salegens TaxID=1737568 RepID=UPI000A9DBC77|nr:PEPxxWA-CTERM sorting domain-containing protein [Croceibacterium salegens]
MKALKKTLLAAVCLTGCMVATPASATVYLVNVSGNGLSANGSVTTDGTIGALTTSNITDWFFDLDDGFSTFSLNGPSNSTFLTSSGLSATASGLFFDFGGSGYALFQNPYISSGINFVCFTGSQLCGGGTNRVSVSVNNFGAGFTLGRGGLQQIGSATIGAVPEPATWALLLLGFMGIGGALRSAKRKQRVSVSYA